VAHGEFENPGRTPSPATGTAAIEAEEELIEVAREMRVAGGSLVGAQQPPLRQGGHAVHRRQQLARVLPAGAGGPLAAPVVAVAELADAVVALPGVGDDRRGRHRRLGRLHAAVGWSAPAVLLLFLEYIPGRV